MSTEQQIEAAVEHDLGLLQAMRNAPPEPVSFELQQAMDHDIAILQQWLKDNEGFETSDNFAVDESHRDEW